MAHKGTSTFILQRLTAVLLLPLVIWFLYSVVAHAGANYVDARDWIERPVNAILLGAFVTIGAMHMRIGMMEIVADYIHGGLKPALLAANWAAALGVIAVTWWSLFTIAF